MEKSSRGCDAAGVWISAQPLAQRTKKNPPGSPDQHACGEKETAHGAEWEGQEKHSKAPTQRELWLGNSRGQR